MEDKNHVKGIVEGFEEDFINIVESFSSDNSELRFLDFLKYWSKESLDCLFANRFDPRELLEAISNLNQILVRILVNPINQDEKYSIIALYFLLAIYVKQPERFRRKIRLTCDDAIYVQNLITKCNSSTYGKDINFVWEQLRQNGSIDLVEERIVYGPSMLETYKSISGTTKNNVINDTPINPLIEMKKDSIEFLESKIEPTIMAFEALFTPYEQLKDSMRLDDYKDPTELNQETNSTVCNYLDEVKLLLYEFKSSLSSD